MSAAVVLGTSRDVDGDKIAVHTEYDGLCPFSFLSLLLWKFYEKKKKKEECLACWVKIFADDILKYFSYLS